MKNKSFLSLVLLLVINYTSFAQQQYTCINMTTKIVRSIDGYSKEFSSTREGIFTTPPSSPICFTQFYFSTYVGTNVTIIFNPNWDPRCGSYIYAPGNDAAMRYSIYRAGNLNPVQTWGDNTHYEFSDYFVQNPITFTPTVKGDYYVVLESWDEGATVPYWKTSQVAYFSAIPKIEKIWIEADPICVDNQYQPPTDQKIHFRVKTIPDIASVMYPSTVTVNTNACSFIDRVELLLACQVNGIDAQSTFSFGNSYAPPGVTVNPNDISGSTFNHYNTSLQTDFWVDYSNLQYYITGAGKGHPVVMDLNLQDGIAINQTLHAPMLINFPSGTSTPGASSFGNSAYQSMNYTVPNNIPVTTSTPIVGETWTPASNPAQAMYGTSQSVYKINNKLVIPAGKQLTIQNMEIQFGPQGSVEVQTSPGSNKPGGVLVLNNSTLTHNGDCINSANYWQGVKVWGDLNKDQQYIPGTMNYAQGFFQMQNNSKISFASWGITNTGPDYIKSGDRAGGIIKISDSRFENNLRSVNFTKYQFGHVKPIMPYVSSFNNCDFIVDQNLPTPFIGFIGGWSVRGVTIKGCRFTDNSTQASTYKEGVYGTDFGVLIDQSGTVPSEFHNLNKAVDLATVSGVASATIRNSSFDNNTTSVSLNGLPAPIVTYNKFIQPSGTASLNSMGLQINTGSGYQVFRNSFMGSSGTTYNTGVNVINTGSSANEVRNNDYNGLWCGNLSNFLNRSQDPTVKSGLQFLCNTNSSNQHDMAARAYTGGINGSTPYIMGMADQGSNAKSAGNTFSAGALYNIYNNTNEVVPISYYYSGSSSGSQYPKNVIGVSKFNGGYNDCVNPGDNNSGLPHYIIAPYLSDPNLIPQTSDLYLSLAQWVSPYSDLTKTDLLIDEGNYSDANATYNSIASTYKLSGIEATEFSSYGRQLMNIKINLLQNEKDLNELTPQMVNDLEGIAINAQMWAKVRARNWLTLYDGRTFVTDMLFPDGNSNNGYSKMAASNVNKSNYSISPNPTKDIVNINFIKHVNEDQILIIRDITGRILASLQLIGLQGILPLDLSEFNSGIYLYDITGPTGKVSYGKLIKE